MAKPEQDGRQRQQHVGQADGEIGLEQQAQADPHRNEHDQHQRLEGQVVDQVLVRMGCTGRISSPESVPSWIL